MSTKAFIWIGFFVGSTIGAYVPAIWGVSSFSFTSALAATVGGLIGIWAGFKIGS